MEDWVEENKELILDSLYERLSDFLDSKDDVKLVLKLIIKSTGHIKMSQFKALAFEFMLVREELLETIDGMLRHFESIEEYEKCAELVKMKERYNQSKIKPIVIKKVRKSKLTNKNE
jgi:hypothetical protein